MKKVLLMGLVLMFTLLQGVLAQTRTVSGRVTDQQSGEGLPGVTVLVKGTTNGISTNANGSYSLTVPATGGVLVFSSVGMATQERPIGSEAQINVGLAQDTKQLSEVVVTALGIEKDTRSLGYSTQQIKAEQISQKSEPNVLNSLQGKVSGVNITSSSGLPGSSTNINIRGITSLQGSNQPLFVVDGIPISNDLERGFGGGGQGSLGAAQVSNRALDIDPESIASINILKGPAAAALYGSRASSGAIIITTKNGSSANKKLEVVATSSFNVQNVYGTARLQTDYGQGSNGIINTAGTGNFFNPSASSASFGPRFGTTPTLANGLILADGSLLPYQNYPNNIRDFYRQGNILTNGVNIAGGNADQNVSLNVSNTNQKGITPNSELNRTNVLLGGNVKLLNKLKAGGSVSFIQTDQSGVSQGNNNSAFSNLSFSVPRSLNLQGLPYVDENTGANLFFQNTENPYFSVNKNTTTSAVTRFINVATLSYDVTPWLNVLYRAGLDTYTDRRKTVFVPGSRRNPLGLIQDQSLYRSEFNGDLIITAKKENIFLEGLNASLLVGQNVNQRRNQGITSQSENLAVPGFFNAQNGSVFSNGTGESTILRRLLGVYSQLSLAYNNYLFLELTGRADQSSTLPVANNTFFYPSATASFVFTDALKISNSLFSYGKIRANISKVGKDADPFALRTLYRSGSVGNNVASINFPFTTPNGTFPGFVIGNTIGSNTLTPEFTKSYEVGTNLGFFNNRLSLELTGFYTRSENQIIAVSIASSTGFGSLFSNVGRVDNTGFEGLMNINPVRTPHFRWDVTANFTRIKNEVVSITEGVTTSTINGGGFIGSQPSFAVGQPYGVIIGNALPRVQAIDPITGKANDPQYVGKYIINPTNGTFAPGIPNSVIANPNPLWLGGITNTFNYRGLELSALVDAKYGGEVLSFTNASLKGSGNLYETGINRDAPRIIPGVIRNTDGTGTFRPNNIEIDTQTYWGASGGLQSPLNVYDATVYRLREVSLGYSLPKDLLERTPFGQVRLSVSGRNLYYYAPNANFDPELNTQGAGNIRGLDLQGAPNTRNYGVNLRFTL